MKAPLPREAVENLTNGDVTLNLHGLGLLCDTDAYLRAELATCKDRLQVAEAARDSVLKAAGAVIAAISVTDTLDAIGRLGSVLVGLRPPCCHACDEDSRCPEHQESRK